MNKIIDKLIFLHLTEKWKKVSYVVGKVLIEGGEELKELKDHNVAERIQLLADSNKIEVRGNIEEMRFSEIRIKNRT